MSVQSVVTLNTHAYNPAGISGGIAKWNDKSASASYPSILTERVSGPTDQGVYRIQFKLDLPSIVTEDSTCACVGTQSSIARLDATVIVPASFTAAERLNLQLQITALFASSVAVSAIKDLEAVW